MRFKIVEVSAKKLAKATKIYNKYNPYKGHLDMTNRLTDFSNDSEKNNKRFVRLNKMFLRVLGDKRKKK